MRKVLRSVLATVDAAFASDAESSPTALFVGELTKEISCPDAPAELGPLVYRKKERFEDLAVSVRELGPPEHYRSRQGTRCRTASKARKKAVGGSADLQERCGSHF